MKEEREITFLSLILSMSFLDHVALFTPLIYKVDLMNIFLFEFEISLFRIVLFTGVKPLMSIDDNKDITIYYMVHT